MELGEGEAEDYGEDWTTNVAEKDGEESGNVPICAAADDEIKVQTELIALFEVSGGKSRCTSGLLSRKLDTRVGLLDL